VRHFRFEAFEKNSIFRCPASRAFESYPCRSILKKNKFRTILEDNIFCRRMTVAPQYGTSGSKLKKSLGEGRADIHGYQPKKRKKELNDRFSLSPRDV
jgi:hypothetical protein